MITKGYVDTTFGQMHFRNCREGHGVPLVLLHMNAASSQAFERIMRELEGRFPLVAFDTMNYGESFRTTKPPDMGFIASVMLEALSNMGVQRFHTLGHHTGASIAVEMAAQAPHRVLSATLNGPTYATAEELAYFGAKLALPNPIDVKGTQLIWAWSRIKDNIELSVMRETPHAAEIMNRDVIDMLRAGENWHWAYQAVFAHNLVAAMKRVRCPMFLLIGRQDVSYPFHERTASAYPHLPTYVHDDGGAYLLESHAPEAAAKVAAFIEAISDNQQST